VLRGGSWNNNQSNARCAYRNNNNPDNHNDNNGVRLATRPARPPEMHDAATCAVVPR
jgi:formylglycine-generating enzyme required for sulfatase activity